MRDNRKHLAQRGIFSLSSLSVGMFLTSARAPFNDRPGDLGYFRNQCVQESWYVRASRKIGALPRPQRHKIRLARSLSRDREVSDQASLQRIWKNLDSFSIQLFHQPIVNSPRESSREALGKPSMPGTLTKQSLAMQAAGAGLFAGQEHCTHLDTIGPESQSRD